MFDVTNYSADVPMIYPYSRVSDPRQVKGHGLTRQGDAFSQWLDNEAPKGMAVETNLTLVDRGVSAFRGANRVIGTFSNFVLLARAERIKKGSIFAIEKLDRMSREPAYKSMALFLEIIGHGIDIVTFGFDGRFHFRHDADYQVQGTNIMWALMSLMRGNEESEVKSTRVGKAWKRKREDARTQRKPMTELTPAWIELDRTAGKYILIPERVKIVVEIFERAAAGEGRRTIAKDFNRRHEPRWGRGDKRGDAWHASYIGKILNNRAVLGEFQPGQHPKGGSWTPDGDDPIKDYFPRVIKDALWHRAQFARSTRRNGTGGNPETQRNLFQGLAFCGDCGGRMTYEYKGKKSLPKLVCAHHLRLTPSEVRKGKQKCTTSRRYDYRRFEASMLLALHTEASALLNHETEQQSARRAELEIEFSKLAELQRNLDRWTVALDGEESPPKTLIAKLSKIEQSIEETKTTIAAMEREVRGLPAVVATPQGVKALQQSLRRFKTNEERRELNARIKRLIERITFTTNRDGGATISAKFFSAAENSKKKDAFTADLHIGPENAPDPVETAFMKRLPMSPRFGAINDDEQVLARRLETRGWLKVRRLNAGWRASRLIRVET
ncbi:MAG: recombinase family protein [Xanthobacteraceae bacterium]|nr:recombinase family protein [Xanthobacteraceae bacterium]